MVSMKALLNSEPGCNSKTQIYLFIKWLPIHNSPVEGITVAVETDASENRVFRRDAISASVVHAISFLFFNIKSFFKKMRVIEIATANKGGGMVSPLPHCARTGYAHGPEQKAFTTFTACNYAVLTE